MVDTDDTKIVAEFDLWQRKRKKEKCEKPDRLSADLCEELVYNAEIAEKCKAEKVKKWKANLNRPDL